MSRRREDQMWDSWSDKERPRFTDLANAVIEHMLETGYHVSVYWFTAFHRGPRVTIDVSKPHAIHPEWPGSTLGRIDCGPDPTEICINNFTSERLRNLDSADPAVFDHINQFFMELAGK